ncbi:MAG: ROK family protein [Bacteroidales bacterium]|nr:ROK family protein [Bacteroidales bacterium]
MKTIVAGVDIGGTNTVVGLVTRDGECIAETTFPTQSHINFNKYLERLASEISALIKMQPSTYSLVGVGVGAPNGCYNTGNIVDAANLKWKGSLPLGSGLNSHLNVPIAVSNDANAAALGEMLYGGARGMKNFIVITLGTGLGSGIVVDGKLVLGSDGFAGELGHTAVKAYGRQCGCGKSGCLETYVSAPGLRRTAFKLLADSIEPSALRNYSYDQISAKQIGNLAEQGDAISIEAFEYTGAILGMKLADVVAILSPEAIFLFGGLSNAGRLLFEPTKRHMEKNLFSNFRNKVQILPSGLNGENAAVIGAAALIWQDLDKNV